MEKVYHSVLKF